MKSRGEASPTWFGPAERPLFGWVHRPAGPSVRSLVVVCPSLGQEAVFAHYPLRALADDLAALGCVVVRFDYDGTGDSAGAGTDLDRVAAWSASIDAAIDLGRRHTDAPLVLLGFRFGALLAVEAAARRPSDLAGLVLWDAPRTGRQFLRELVIRQNVSVGAADSTAGFTALGVSLDEQTRSDVAALDLREYPQLPAACVVSLERPGAPTLPAGATTRDGHPVERLDAPDQDDLLARQAVPVRSIDTLAQWVTRAFPTADADLFPAPPTVTEIVRDGVCERVVAVGPNRLFGIVTEPAHSSGGSTVVFVPDSITPHGGLGRIWTDLAREWAGHGVRSLRFDLSGCADSPARDGEPSQTVGLLAHLDDAVDALRHANPSDPQDTVVVGLCSGAYLAVEAALTVRPRGMVLVNPVMSFVTPEPRPDERRRAIVVSRRWASRLFGRLAGRMAVTLARTTQTPAFTNDPNFAWHRAFEACFWQIYLHEATRRLPDRAWRLLNRLLTTAPGIDRSVAAALAGGTEVLLLAGDPDFERATLGARRALHALERPGSLRLEHQPGLDHAMMRPGAITAVGHALGEFVLPVATPVRSREQVPA